MSDLKLYLEKQLPSIKEEEQNACEELPDGWRKLAPRLCKMNGWIGRKIPLLPGNSSLGQGNKNNIFQFKAKVTIKNLQKEPYGHQKNYKIKNKNIKTNTVGGP